MSRLSKPPPPPHKPDPEDCCGGGCVPCVYDYYYQQVDEWEARYKISVADYEREQKADQDSVT
ncbi:MAG: hypothetical protein HKN85_02930 [Gammaproteobacteria bacterium]|nr:hypothetical protein [Gammaproteobacteria bacterium]